MENIIKVINLISVDDNANVVDNDTTIIGYADENELKVTVKDLLCYGKWIVECKIFVNDFMVHYEEFRENKQVEIKDIFAQICDLIWNKRLKRNQIAEENAKRIYNKLIK